MKILAVFYLIVIALSLCSCSQSPSINAPESKAPSVSKPQTPAPQASADYLEALRRLDDLAVSNPDEESQEILGLLLGTKFTEGFHFRVPRNATIIKDYGGHWILWINWVVNLGGALKSRLPPSIQDILKSQGIDDKSQIDISLVAQHTSAASGNFSDRFSRLVPHGWADPDAPAGFTGTRVKRDFLHGVFEADYDIAWQVPLDRLEAFEVHTHDGAFSPQTARIKSPPLDKSTSFWSLVIDHHPLEGPKRAVATLHWHFSDSDWKIFTDTLFTPRSIVNGVSIPRKLKERTFKGQYHALESVFKNQIFFKKLSDLLGSDYLA